MLYFCALQTNMMPGDYALRTNVGPRLERIFFLSQTRFVLPRSRKYKIHKEDAKADDYAKHGWVTTCWNTITKSLHDEILLKVAHVERGHIETLLKEIASSLTVFTQDEVSPLRLEIYGATMEKCGSDLQSFIAYIQTRQRKLVFLKKAMPEEELVGILINGLHPVMQQLKIHLRITTPKKWDEAVQIIRTHCASPEMVVELNKLKAAGLSQHMFPLAHPPQQMAPTPHRQQPCRNFARGRCNSGTSCRFSHKLAICDAVFVIIVDARPIRASPAQPQRPVRVLLQQRTRGARLPQAVVTVSRSSCFSNGSIPECAGRTHFATCRT